MRILADENIVPAHVSALESAGYDVRRVGDVLEKGAGDAAVLNAASQENRVVLILVAVILLLTSLCYLRIQTLSTWILNSSFHVLTATSITYDKKDFSDTAGHPGVLLASETMAPRKLRNAVERVEQAYPELEDVVEYLSDWA